MKTGMKSILPLLPVRFIRLVLFNPYLSLVDLYCFFAFGTVLLSCREIL